MLDLNKIAESRALFDGRYKLLRPLNTEGATADVWLALDTSTIDTEHNTSNSPDNENAEEPGLLVAIKIYRPKNALDSEGEQRFRKEFKVAYDCHHTNLLQPTSFSVFDGIPYLILPYCRKGSSEQLIGKLKKTDEIWKFIADVSSGLARLHSNQPQIIHQDIKPANILIVDDNYSITDFGISSQNNRTYGIYEDEENSGTLAYMAPERFEDLSSPIPESDIWAFGSTLCEIITGEVPFGEEGGKSQLAGGSMISLKAIPASIRPLIKACLQQDPAKRPTAQEISIAAQAKKFPLKKNKALIVLSILSVIALISWGLIKYLSLNKTLENTTAKNTKLEQIDDNMPIEKESVKDVFDNAKFQMNSDNPDIFYKGYHTMDSLSNTQYIPAMFEIAFTHGWFTDSLSFKRKKMLNITFDTITKGKPKDQSHNEKAQQLLTQILQQHDTTYAGLNSHALFTLAIYAYNDTLAVRRTINDEDKLKVKELFQQSREWACLCNDTSRIRKCDDAIEKINKK